MATVVTVKKRTSASYGGGSSGSSGGASSSTRRPVDYSSIGGGLSTGGSSSSSSGSSGGSSSGSSSNSSNLPTGTYTEGDKYAGGNTFVRPDGSTYQVTGEFTSPSGKVTYTDDNGNITVVDSANKSEIGKVYNTSGTEPTYASGYTGNYGNDAYNMQVSALQQAMGSNRDALEDAFYASKRELNNTIKDGQRQAYINQQRALKNLPQTMAAAGYNGGITESTAANISNEYQNALTDLERTKASELARLQTNLANGIADINTQYDLEIANALQQAQQYELQQEQWEEEMKLRQAAAAWEQERYNRDYALAEREIALKEANAKEAEQTPTLLTVPTSLTAATQQSIAGNNMEPLMVYYKSQGWSDADILAELNRYRVDPESAFYGYR